MITAFVMDLVATTHDLNSHMVFVYYLFPGFALGWGLVPVLWYYVHFFHWYYGKTLE